MQFQDIVSEKYLSTGFKELNTGDYDRWIESYDLNYQDLIGSSDTQNILDIGCGMGHFLYYLKKRGYKNFLGVDIGREQIEHCRVKVTNNVKRVENIFGFLNERKNSYDLIVLNDVLEHFNRDDTINLLQQIVCSLKKGGRLLIKTPNMGSLFACASLSIDFTHQIGFSEISLPQVLRAVGFSSIGVRPEKIYISSKIKSMLFTILRMFYFMFLKFLVFIDRPGDNYPTIFSKNIIAWADK
ncbi:MAG: hypothetical protein A2Y00_03095 [Omnitrophica WOR_2 bacterium GWF2_43_52]|nr:MAG: hypothetical protein A2Y00_03095 [Omnitrophica WOR_2 bacterium GWF2_43_52]OGX57629.1 MAG: hypothetical protein A2460_02595 [Omnitrophica WOR_2 bacterium RIFOXYC2_FULL_43_9]HAH20839.1 hypothetical protein [Candidatus Omnitrophota bacterium]HBG64507.1 hypothetical protein [Candidatus Omnitrophota bacterium]HCD38470.1 hypothetical protein [Candidatus Omnitrophota bacterium]